MQHDYSIIPVKLIPCENGKVKKPPNVELLKKATGGHSWKVFEKRLPASREREIFLQATHQAIVTGKISGVTVIDLDGTSEQWLKEQGYELPLTPTVKTQSGGKHLYFKYTDRLITSSDINGGKKYGRGIDVRNDGGYAVAFGEGYEWIHHIHDTELQEVPEIFLNMKREIVHLSSITPVPNRNISESICDAYSKARNVDMVTFLCHNGYDVQERHPFSCIFHDHADENPSAQIVVNDSGEHRYICYSHPNGNLNLSLIDLWAELRQIETKRAVREVLAFDGIEFQESPFVQAQKEKYHFNTVRIGDMEYIGTNFPYLYKYLNRYELELRALMDYAESNLHGTEYSFNEQAVFYISVRYAGSLFAKVKRVATVNTKRANTLLNLLCTFDIMERVPSANLTQYAKNSTAKLNKEGRDISFYLFNQLTDYVLSIADRRAKIMQENKFKVATMSKDMLLSLFGQGIADKVFPDTRKVSTSYQEFLDLYAKIILSEIEGKGYTTKQEAVSKASRPITKRMKEHHFDKVINEICNMYDLEFDFVTKEISSRFHLATRGRKRLIYKA